MMTFNRKNFSIYFLLKSPRSSLAIKSENGVKSYSADNGKTWSQNAPDGAVVNCKNNHRQAWR